MPELDATEDLVNMLQQLW